ncbi:hypothetical protein EDC94DRAFT_653046 [Helicostylum pulchrum]|nr:hypothetical protein EDC94DRAFT_653046 [Helicostylum pulchrum]
MRLFKSIIIVLYYYENGLVKGIWGHDYFVPDTRFSEVTTLNVKNSFINISDINNRKINGIIRFIKSVKEHLKDKWNISSSMIYKNAIISRKLPTVTISHANIKIGCAITIGNMLLKRLFGTEDDLRDVIYDSNLVQKDDGYKKLRIATHGEGLFHAFFVVAQLYENHVQLTLNQIVTQPDLDNEDQEAVIIQEEMIPIPNIYDTLCCNMWNNITEDSSLIQLCDTRKGYNDYELLEIFTLENQAEFTNNLKEHISKNILNKTLNKQTTDTTTLSLNTSCNCRVCLTAFQVGVLYHVHSKNYGFSFDARPGLKYYKFKNKISDSKIPSIDKESVFPLVKKGNRIYSTQLKRLFYLSCKYETFRKELSRLKKADTLSFDKTIREEDKLESICGPVCFVDNYKRGHYISFIISILYKGHSSSISFAVKKVGDEI